MNLTRKFSVAVSQAGGITQKKLRRLKGRRWKYPLSLERRYATAISRYLKKQWKEYEKLALAVMVPRSDAIDLEDSVTKGPAIGAIVTIAEDFNKFNKKEMDAFRRRLPSGRALGSGNAAKVEPGASQLNHKSLPGHEGLGS